MLKIGLTGGIGSGKTTVARIFETLGIPVYYADEAAKRLMNEDAVLKEKLVAAFGSQTYTDEGRLNRSYLAAQVFSNPQKLELLNALTHPATIADAEKWMAARQAPYAIKEAALIFESGSAAGLDLVIGVWAPPALRIQRTMERDGSDRQAVLHRMARQIEESIKMKLCDIVINNDEQQLLTPQVLALHEQLLNAEPGQPLSFLLKKE
ncbi:MAG TPA: dephospho-CoA kinase [Chitinophagaceae bacterium]|nr:dephospho-CoA kinase [Chitinophagaceae bacterium]